MKTPDAWLAEAEPGEKCRVCESAAHESSSARSLRLRLAERIRDVVKTGRLELHPIEGLHLSYIEESRQAKNCIYHLSVGVILLGEKRLLIGSDEYRYGPGSAIVTSIDMPTSYELVNVSKEAPFVSLSLPLNTATLAELIQDDEATSQAKSVFSVEPSSEELMEDFYRLLALLDKPEQIALRAPLIIRDIHCLALSGAGGDCLRALYAPDAAGKRIRLAIRWLRENFRSEVTIDRLAEVASMAPSTFHRHFREFTSLTPLQYQKRLRLYEAQQLLLKGGIDANSAAYAVGYMSPAQFSRDYKRLFGEPPGRHIKEKLARLQEAVVRNTPTEEN